MSVNLDGALVCTRAVYRKMAKRGGGAIVNQSSTAAWLYANFYGLAKVGINGLTQQLSRELGGQNIRINAIAPGPIDTEANRTTTPQEMVADIVKGIPLSRMGQPEDLVGMCLFLLCGSGQVDHRPDLQRRRRTDHPVIELAEHALKLGYIGLGNMGAPDGQAAGRLARRAHRSSTCAPRPWTPLVELGATAGRQRRRCRRGRRHQRHGAQRRAGARRGRPSCAAHAKPGTVIAIHSTIEPGTAAELRRAAATPGHSHRRRPGQRWGRRGRQG